MFQAPQGVNRPAFPDHEHFTLRFRTGFSSPDGEPRTRSGQVAASTEPTDCRDGTDESTPVPLERMLSPREMALVSGPARSSPHPRSESVVSRQRSSGGPFSSTVLPSGSRMYMEGPLPSAP